MTNYGGIIGLGVLFEYDITNNIFIKKVDFDVANKGWCPTGNLIEANNGKLYGMTSSGGSSLNYGVLFEFDPLTNIYEKKLNFEGNNGLRSCGSLINASNGKLYGLASSGGLMGWGALFEFDPIASIYSVKYSFHGNNGEHPYGDLIQTSDGKFYGMTQEGGTNNYGVLFEFDPATNIYSIKLNFDNSNSGCYPYGSLLQASNGKLYGTTTRGGLDYYGVLFEYNLTNNIFIKKLDFNGNNGKEPQFSQLIELYGTHSIKTITKAESDYSILPNPTTGKFVVKASDIKEIEILNMNGKSIIKLKPKNDQSIIDLSSQSKGIYFVKITTKDCVAVRKVVLE